MTAPTPNPSDDFTPATDPSTLNAVAVGDFIRAEGTQFGEPRTWGGRITRIGRDEHGLYFDLREPIQAGVLWEGTANTITDAITIVTDEAERATIIKTGNFTAKRPRPRIGGYKGQHHHGFPENGDWTGHRIAHYAGNNVTLWGDCLHDGDGDIWVIFDGESNVYTATRGEIYICEHERPCGKSTP
jgi:hypothetical protein